MSIQKTHLSDLDELAQRVRETTSKTYILEAITNYRGASYRSALVSTWIAVCYDIIAKFRELSNQGDPNASSFIAKLDGAISSKQLRSLQSIENSLLEEAVKAEFINDIENQSLARLEEDRNLCAHPAFSADQVLYQPTPDLVRTHIAHSIIYLLANPPIQGKKALSKLTTDLSSTAFPITYEGVKNYISHQYVSQCKQTVLENMVTLCEKEYLLGLNAALKQHKDRLLNTLLVFSEIIPEIYIETIKTKLPTLVSSMQDTDLCIIGPWIRSDNRVSKWMGVAQTERLKAALTSAPIDTPDQRKIFSLVSHQEFGSIIRTRFNSLEDSIKRVIITENPGPEFVDVGILLYSQANSFRSAEILGEMILQFSPYLNKDHVIQIIDSAERNGQIYQAAQTPVILSHLFDKTLPLFSDSSQKWDAFIKAQIEREMSFETHYSYPDLRKRMEPRGYTYVLPTPTS